MAVKCIDKKIVDTIAKGSFHQGDLSIFSAESVGKQCIRNCFAVVSFTKLVPLYKWSSDNINSILRNGDSIYKTIKSNHDLLHVSDVGSRIHPHGCNSQGMSSQNGTAVLMRFKCRKHVVDFLKKKFSKPSNIF